MDKIKDLFRRRTPLEMAAKEMVEAQHGLLEAQSGLDYAAAMVEYHTDRINRLRAYVALETGK